MLLAHNHEIVLLGREIGSVNAIPIVTTKEAVLDKEIDTVTIYVSPQNQSEYRDYLIQLRPRRVIFNPGTENHDLSKSLNRAGILTEEACTLVLLSTNQY
jgi:predicted CoA-binding protein